MIALILRPPGIPRHVREDQFPESGSQGQLVIAGLDSPRKEKILTPGLFSVPKLRYHSAPLVDDQRHIGQRLHVVDHGGLAIQPKEGGKGGRRRGCPSLPSSDSSMAVSSPQMYAPAPRWYKCAGNNRCRTGCRPTNRPLPSRQSLVQLVGDLPELAAQVNVSDIGLDWHKR
jgi:hypothetical protein